MGKRLTKKKKIKKKKHKKNTSITGEGITTLRPSSLPHHIISTSSSDSDSDNDNENDWSVFEILNRLPVKTLTRFRSVCKRWYRLIEKDQQFIDLHLTRSKTRLPSRLFIVVPLPSTQIEIETLKSMRGTCHDDSWPFKEFHLTADLVLFQQEEDEDDIAKAKLVVDTVREIDSESYNVISKPVNGLVCLIDSYMNHVVRILNISTGEMSPLFESSSSIVVGEECVSLPSFYAFGFDPATNEHKLVCVLTVSSGSPSIASIVCGILSIGCHNNGWRRIEEIPPYSLKDDYVHVNGVIYWSNCSLNHWRWKIHCPDTPVCLVAFDLGTEKFRTIAIPDFILDRHSQVLGDYLSFKEIFQLFEVDGYLTMVVKLNNCTFNMYTYEDDYYEEEDEELNGMSTTSLRKGRWSEVRCISLPLYMMINDVKFHTFMGSGDKILVTSSTTSGMEKKKRLSIYCYNWKKGTWTEVDVSGIPCSVPQLSHHCFFTTFSESLLAIPAEDTDI